MAVLMNSAVNTIAIVNTRTAQSCGGNPSHRPITTIRLATTEWIQAFCWVWSTCHQPRKACPKAAMRERMNSLNDIILLESELDRARVFPVSRPALSTSGLFLRPGRDRVRANAALRAQPAIALPIQAGALLHRPVPGREGSR